MTINRIEEGDKLILQVEGWLDTSTSPELGSVVEKIDNIRFLVFDFAKLEYISSAGLRQVVAANRKAKEIGAEFSIINTGAEVMSVFKLTELDKKINIRTV